MKCKLCGFRTTEIARMAKHYRKAHPTQIRRKKQKTSAVDVFLGRPQKELIKRLLKEIIKEELKV